MEGEEERGGEGREKLTERSKHRTKSENRGGNRNFM